MDFHINKNSTLPILRLELVHHGKSDMSDFYNKLQNSNIFFTMYDLSTGVKKIGKKRTISERIGDCTGDTCLTDEYYLSYQFTEKETSTPGTYIGQFTIEFLDGTGTLIVPIKEELKIHILESSIKK